jgi:hypothetical protein
MADLKYKQFAGRTPPQQMVAVGPDLVQIHIGTATDQFIILVCAGYSGGSGLNFDGERQCIAAGRI